MDRNVKMNKSNLFISALLCLYDIAMIASSFLCALLLRFDLNYSAIPVNYLEAYKHSIFIVAIFTVAVFYFLKLYRSIWRFASYQELTNTTIGTAVSFVFNVVFTSAVFGRMPISYYVFGIFLQFGFILGIRFCYRLVKLLIRLHEKRSIPETNVMLIGAGEAGKVVIREVNSSNELNEKIVCIIDDNENLWGRFVNGIPVVGGREEILSAVYKYDVKKIYFAIPTASLEVRKEFLNICNEAECEVKALPGIYQLAKGEVYIAQMKPVLIEDLLGRDPIRVNLEEVFAFLSGKVILVTGGGGSIGSELCRQIAAHNPKQLIIFDVYENNAYDIQMELKDKYPELNLVTLIGSVRDSRRIDSVFAKYHPDVVDHAAAHKHVPLMEDSPCESIKNNAIGTYKTAYAAMKHGTKRFVLISTDKAVNPTNIMGASKRLCEMVIQSFDKKIKEGKTDDLPMMFTHYEDEDNQDEYKKADLKPVTEFVAVRFGNVLGSNGSVIPLFKKQIAKGGPVTVTHPDIIRYFMTIPEAVSLVLQAGTYAHGGEIFVLDMGSPVKIDTLARNLIRQSGFKPDVDIKIEYTGLRPGEKLYEEKLMSEEGLQKTKNKLIHIGSPIPFDTDTFLVQLNELMSMAYANDEQNIFNKVEEVVPTFKHAPLGTENKTKAYREQFRVSK